MAKPNPIGLQITKGYFELKGIVKGTDKDNFYKEFTTRTNKSMRMISFGVECADGKTIYVRMNGVERDKVYFSRSVTINGKKASETVEVPWSERFTFHEDDCRMMGVNLGIKKTNDDKGNMVNDKRIMTEYDACKYIADELEEGVSIYVKGKIEYSTYEEKQRTNFVPTQISLCKPVDFNDPNFEEQANFTQTLMFMSVNQLQNEFSVSSKIVDYNSLENAEFVIENTALARNFKTLKPYTSIKVYGKIKTVKDTTEVKSTGHWGEANPMERVNNPTVWKLVIIGADESSIDTTLYNEKSVTAAIDKLNAEASVQKDFGNSKKTEQSGSWGETPNNTFSDDDEDDIPW